MTCDPSQQRAQVRAFLERRPHYLPLHVYQIARYNRREEIPFCWECGDWHYPEEEHTTEGVAP